MLALTTALGFNVLSNIQPKEEGTRKLDLNDNIVRNKLVELGGNKINIS